MTTPCTPTHFSIISPAGLARAAVRTGLLLAAVLGLLATAFTSPAVAAPATAQAVYVGQPACHQGRVSGRHCGYITALNVTITTSGGTYSGLIRTNICSEAGDNGAPLTAAGVVVAHLIGGSGNCTTGGSSYYVPV